MAPAAERFTGESILTDVVLSYLTTLSLSHVTLFTFADSVTQSKYSKCKTYPEDSEYPNDSMWDVFDLLTGGALIKAVPLASVCYDSRSNRDAVACSHITKHWNNVSIHYLDLSDLMYPLWQGLTCLPTNEPADDCSLGGFPSYIVNATNVA